MTFQKSQAVEIDERDNLRQVGSTRNDLYCFERLYQMPDGTWYLYGSGNKQSKYGDGNAPGCRVWPIAPMDAMEFMIHSTRRNP